MESREKVFFVLFFSGGRGDTSAFIRKVTGPDMHFRKIKAVGSGGL